MWQHVPHTCSLEATPDKSNDITSQTVPDNDGKERKRSKPHRMESSQSGRRGATFQKTRSKDSRHFGTGLWAHRAKTCHLCQPESLLGWSALSFRPAQDTSSTGESLSPVWFLGLWPGLWWPLQLCPSPWASCLLSAPTLTTYLILQFTSMCLAS